FDLTGQKGETATSFGDHLTRSIHTEGTVATSNEHVQVAARAATQIKHPGAAGESDREQFIDRAPPSDVTGDNFRRVAVVELDRLPVHSPERLSRPYAADNGGVRSDRAKSVRVSPRLCGLILLALFPGQTWSVARSSWISEFQLFVFYQSWL